MLTSRALKTIGASVAASTLLLVAGCSSDEQGNAEAPTTEAQGETSEAAPSEETTTETSESAEVEDFSQLLDGITYKGCLLYTSPSPRDRQKSRMPSSA